MFWFQQDIAIWKIIYELHSLGVKKSTMTFTFDLVTLYQKLCLCEAWTKRESGGSIHALDKDILHYHLWLTIDQEIFLKVTACTLFDQRHSASEVRVRMDQGKKILIQPRIFHNSAVTLTFNLETWFKAATHPLI